MIGDIILQKRSGWVGWFVSLFTRSDYVHVGIDVGGIFDEHTVVHVDWMGKRFTCISEWGDDIIVLTPVAPLTASQTENLLVCIYRTNVRGYDFFQAIKSWLWKNTNDEKP